MPELCWRAEDHCGDPGTAGNREAPHALGIAGQGTASCAGPWAGAASGLTLPNRDSSGDPVTRAAGVGCVRGFAGLMEGECRAGITRSRRPRRTIFSGAVNAQQFCGTFKDHAHGRRSWVSATGRQRESGRTPDSRRSPLATWALPGGPAVFWIRSRFAQRSQARHRPQSRGIGLSTPT